MSAISSPHPASAAALSPVAIIGGGPAGLMAAERLAANGMAVTVFDAMPSVGRKFLLAGRGGLNLTHSEPFEPFLSRYGAQRDRLTPMLQAFGPQALQDWAHGLGVDTFVGSSGRVFPTEMKAAPLLRAWLTRLRAAGVRFEMRHSWLGWDDATTPTAQTTATRTDPSSGGQSTSPTDPAAHPNKRAARQRLRFSTPDGERLVDADAVLLALGGGSWAKLGSDGAWVPVLRAAGVDIADLRPANCGFDIGGFDIGGFDIGGFDIGAPDDDKFQTGRADGIGWSAHFLERFRGQPLKSVAAHFIDASGKHHQRAGECLVSASGIEGGLIYALSAALRDTIAAQGGVTLHLDLAPGRSLERLSAELARPRGSRSMASHLQGQAGIKGVKAALLRECLPRSAFDDPGRLAAGIKALPLTLVAPRPLDEAISSAGGVRFAAVDENLMLRAWPGVFVAGEMLDWEAPTGGYLLTACFATGVAAAHGLGEWMSSRQGKARG
ncbi:MAG TPA: TIGR03862 family flavoprotein [Thauera sp.]|nr:TIGR03862 family flavoprotein [Thauera sp.]